MLDPNILALGVTASELTRILKSRVPDVSAPLHLPLRSQMIFFKIVRASFMHYSLGQMRHPECLESSRG